MVWSFSTNEVTCVAQRGFGRSIRRVVERARSYTTGGAVLRLGVRGRDPDEPFAVRCELEHPVSPGVDAPRRGPRVDPLPRVAPVERDVVLVGDDGERLAIRAHQGALPAALELDLFPRLHAHDAGLGAQRLHEDPPVREPGREHLGVRIRAANVEREGLAGALQRGDAAVEEAPLLGRALRGPEARSGAARRRAAAGAAPARVRRASRAASAFRVRHAGDAEDGARELPRRPPRGRSRRAWPGAARASPHRRGGAQLVGPVVMTRIVRSSSPRVR